MGAILHRECLNCALIYLGSSLQRWKTCSFQILTLPFCTNNMADTDQLKKRLMMGLVSISAAIITYVIYKRLNSVKDKLCGPAASNKEFGNLSDMSRAGSLHEYLQELSAKYGPIGAFWWAKTRVAYITSQKVLLDEHNKQLLHNVSDRPPFLFDGFKPLLTEHSIQYQNGDEFQTKYHKVWITAYQKQMSSKMPIMQKLAQRHVQKWSKLIGIRMLYLSTTNISI